VRKLAKIFSGLLAAYIFIYMMLSSFGSYQPNIIGTFGIEQSLWAPYGFYDATHPWSGSLGARLSKDKKTGGWNTFMCWTFLPLWVLDTKYIHKNSLEVK
jgi:hypothetical protein